MAELTLKQLRYFDAVARAGHFGRAAAICSISQPAISVQIKEMEQTLGIALFERGARVVRLTAAGEDLIQRVRSILGAVEELSDVARASGGQALARLRLGIIPTIAPYLLPAIMGALGAQHPNLDLHVRETLTPKLLNELSDGKIDAAILALPTSEPSLQETLLFDEDFVLVRPAQDEGKPVPNGEALRKMRLLLLEEGHCFRDQALAFCNTRRKRAARWTRWQFAHDLGANGQRRDWRDIDPANGNRGGNPCCQCECRPLCGTSPVPPNRNDLA